MALKNKHLFLIVNDTTEQDQPLISYPSLGHFASTKIPLGKASQMSKSLVKAHETTLY